MDRKKTVDDLVTLEKRYWQAIKDQDANTCVDLSADGCVVTGAQGVGTFTKDQMLAMIKQNDRYTLDDYTLKDVKAEMMGPDLGVVAYTVHQTLTVDGKPVSFRSADTSTWTRRNGKWECVVHTESILGDPFGRDRNDKA